MWFACFIALGNVYIIFLFKIFVVHRVTGTICEVFVPSIRNIIFFDSGLLSDPDHILTNFFSLTTIKLEPYHSNEWDHLTKRVLTTNADNFTYFTCAFNFSTTTYPRVISNFTRLCFFKLIVINKWILFVTAFFLIFYFLHRSNSCSSLCSSFSRRYFSGIAVVIIYPTTSFLIKFSSSA